MSRIESPVSAVGDAGSLFDPRAAEYDAIYDARTGDGHALRARMAATLRLAGRGPGAALDAGMGPGRLCDELQRRDWVVSGVDASTEMVALARRRVPDAAERLLVGSIEELPFPDAGFDLAVATGVLEYSDARRALAELRRVLKTGGRAVVSYPNAAAAYRLSKTLLVYPLVRAVKGSARQPGPRGAGKIEPERFRDLLASVGFEPIVQEYTSYLPLPAPLDLLLPRVAESAGRRVEGRGGRLAHRLAVQVLYTARKT